MKRIVLIAAILLAAFGQIQAEEGVATKRIMVSQPPTECRNAGYTCILKKVHGEPFWCQRTIRDRIQKARKSVRATRTLKCKARFPVEYITVRVSND